MWIVWLQKNIIYNQHPCSALVQTMQIFLDLSYIPLETTEIKSRIGINIRKSVTPL